MVFTKIERRLKTFTFVIEPRFAVRKTPTGLTGVIKLPPGVVKELGWEQGDCFDVLVGEGEHAGWYGLQPADGVRHRARFKISRNGVGQYASNALVPAGVTDPRNTTIPQANVDGSILYLKLN